MLTDDELAHIWASLPDPLRMESTDGKWFRDVARAVEAAAYEKATQACERIGKEIVCPEECAAAIRALAQTGANDVENTKGQ